MRNPDRIITSSVSSDHKTTMERLHGSAVAAGLSGNARALLVKIILWAGRRGYCWWSIPKIAKAFGRSESAVRRWITELRQADLLQIVGDPGKSSYLIPYPVEFRGPLSKAKGVSTFTKPSAIAGKVGISDRGKEKVQNKKTLVEEPPSAIEPTTPVGPQYPQNVLFAEVQESSESISAPLTAPEPVKSMQASSQSACISNDPQRTRTYRDTNAAQDIVEQIERTTGDDHSRGAFARIARNVSEQDIFRCLSITRCAMEGQIVHRPGAYFLATVKAVTGFRFQTHTSTPPAEQKPSEAPTIGLDGLQSMYAHLQIKPLWKRYQALLPEATLEHYRLFLQRHHGTLWNEKPQYRRL